MKINWAERLLVNNPVRVMIQRLLIRWVRNQQVVAPEARILEVGCGRGAGAGLLLEEFQPAWVHALDLDHRMMRDAAAYLRFSQRQKIFLLVGDAHELPYGNGVLDAVFGFGVLHHLLDWRAGLLEIARVLTAGGIYFLEEFYPPLYQNFLARRLFLHPEPDRFGSPDLHRALLEAGFRLKTLVEQKQLGILAVATKEGGTI
jgi:ubiquinone/menaquinone biosynthesis C-methylase UbiE